MKNILFLLSFLFYTIIGTAQTDKDWLISMDFGIQEHDKRLYHWPRFPRENLLAMQPENYGTYQIGFSISTKIIDNNRFSVYSGVGLSTELATFLRPFRQHYPAGGTKELTYTKRYYQNLLQLPIQSKYRFWKKWAVTLDLLLQFNFLTIADYYALDKTKLYFQPNLYSIELSPGIESGIGEFIFGVKYRAFQIKKIDPILFYSTGVYTMGDEKFETFNPFKLWFSVGYRL